MRRISCVMAISAALTAIGCAGTGATDSSTGTSAPRAAKASEPADAAPAGNRGNSGREGAGAPVAKARDVCALLSPKEIETITGIPIERAEQKPSGCEWYGNAEATRQKGVQTARNTFEKLNKQEPASADDAVRSMQSLLRGVSGAVAPSKALFGVTVQWESGDQAEAMLKGTVAVNAAGAKGGGLEPIDGLGDRAFMGAMGAIFFARKGPALIQFGLGLGDRDQAIALARLVVSRI